MEEQNVVLGVVATIISIVTFGSAYVPIKRFEHRDGIFVSFLMSVGQVLPCFVCSLVHGTTTIYPMALLSGMFYAIGNSFAVFIMDGIGMAIGILLWNAGTTIWAWANQRFGFFGFEVVEPEHNAINVLGVIVICTGSFLGVLAIATLFGNIMTPINYIARNDLHGPTTPHNPAAYILSYSIGALFTSTAIFCAYAGYKRNVPFVNPEIALPTILCGIVYGIAMSTLMISTMHLDQIISYPLICMAPGMITSLYSIFLFHEIRGKKNIIKLIFGFCVTLVGMTLISVSKVKF